MQIDEALSAKAAAEGVNTPVALTPGVAASVQALRRAVHRHAEDASCFDECRSEAKRDAALRSKAKRAGRHESRDQSDQRGRFICAQCGKRRQAARTTKQFCSVKCRVAAHRASQPSRRSR